MLPVIAAPVAGHAGHGRGMERKLAPRLVPGAIVRDHGLTVAVPRRGGFTWGELKFADGTYQELAVETATDGRVFVHGRGDERAAILRERLQVGAFGTDGGRVSPDAGATVKGGRGECVDTYRNLYFWRTPKLEWRFNPNGTPAYLRDEDGGTEAVQAAIVRAQRNILTSRNRCDRGDRVTAKGSLLGLTRRSPNISAGGGCLGGDGHSTIRFADLPSYSIAMTCVYGVRNGIAKESDIRINGVDTRWAVNMATCSGRELLLEAGMTHEFGHAYGLAHASMYRNPALTMQPLVRNCSQAHSTLGLGDMLGLEKKY